MKPTWIPALRATFALTLLAACAACGGGGAGGYTPSAVSQSDRRELPQAFITRASVNSSPYRSSRSVDELAREVITPAQVLEDLRLVQATGIGTIRLFSSRVFARTVLEVIRDHNLDLKVYLGAYPNPITGTAAPTQAGDRRFRRIDFGQNQPLDSPLPAHQSDAHGSVDLPQISVQSEFAQKDGSVQFLQGDFREPDVLAQLETMMTGRTADVVVSDMAPNLSGVESVDAARVEHLVELALDFARDHLKPDGALVAKVFHGSGYSQLVTLFKAQFRVVKPFKPKASRDKSSETFLVGMGLK